MAWDLCQRQTRQILFDTIFIQRASFPLVDMNGFIMMVIRSASVTSLGIFGGARLARFPNCDVVPVDVEKQVSDECRKCERLWSELYKHLKHPTTLSTIKFKGGRNNPL